MTLTLLLFACRDEKPKESTDTLFADIFVDQIGQPIPTLDPSLQDSFQKGAEAMEHRFTPKTGLGPTFNATSCAGCHQMPVPGGSAPRYRDFWLIQEERWDGAMINAGTNGESPVRNLYATPPDFHIAPTEMATTYARRNAPPMFGVGLFAFVSDEDILANADPEDSNGDGISGRANFEKGEVGRFGYKSQAATLESFNRGAIFNQMGITSDPLFYEFLELQTHGRNTLTNPKISIDWLIPTADAQVSALDEPTVDLDDAPDPEISNEMQRDLLVFSTYIGIPHFTPRTEWSPAQTEGERLFESIGCSDCHLPTMPSVLGPLPAYSDLLLHDMGEALADGIQAGFATGSEFRTQPLWSVGLHPPYLHDGRADTLSAAIEWHGGEAAHSRDGWLALNDSEQKAILQFLHTLGATPNQQDFLNDPTYTIPNTGELGGPSRNLSTEEQERFERGLKTFDGNFQEDIGLSPQFNADSCRACHQDPVIGGAGGLDVNVLRIEAIGNESPTNVLHRSVLPTELPVELFDLEQSSTWIIEGRQPPSLLGLGEIEEISTESILANEDPEDQDGDGISGRVRWITNIDSTDTVTQSVGKFGWKAQIPTVTDFVADALLNEIGITIHPVLSDFTVDEDNDSCADPEMQDSTVLDLAFYVYTLGNPITAATQTEPPLVFANLGCASCHIPTLDSVPIFSDLLLHDMGYDLSTVVDQDEFALPSEYRTAPLWGISQTAPYMHDGSAESLDAAIRLHGGEAEQSMQLYLLASEQDREALLNFLEQL